MQQSSWCFGVGYGLCTTSGRALDTAAQEHETCAPPCCCTACCAPTLFFCSASTHSSSCCGLRSPSGLATFNIARVSNVLKLPKNACVPAFSSTERSCSKHMPQQGEVRLICSELHYKTSFSTPPNLSVKKLQTQCLVGVSICIAGQLPTRSDCN